MGNDYVAPFQSHDQVTSAPVVASVVMQPQALHCTSKLSLPNRTMRGRRAPAWTMVFLFSARERVRER